MSAHERTEVRAEVISVDDNGGELTFRVTAHGQPGVRAIDRQQYVITVPARSVPGLMVAVATHGTSALRDVANAWRHGDCPTCLNVRMVEVPAPGGRTTTDYCPDCRRPGGVFTGYPQVRPAES